MPLLRHLLSMRSACVDSFRKRQTVSFLVKTKTNYETTRWMTRAKNLKLQQRYHSSRRAQLPNSSTQSPPCTNLRISSHSPPLPPLPLRLPLLPHLPLQPIQIPKPKLHPPPPPLPSRLLPRPHRRPVLNPLPIRDAHIRSTSSRLARSDDGAGGWLGGGPCCSGGG